MSRRVCKTCHGVVRRPGAPRLCQCPQRRRCHARVTGTALRCRCHARRGSVICYAHQTRRLRVLQDERRAELEEAPVMVRHRKRTEQDPKGRCVASVAGTDRPCKNLAMRGSAKCWAHQTRRGRLAYKLNRRLS